MKKIKTAAVQFNHKPGDKQYNLGVIESLCREAAEKSTKIVVFPEIDDSKNPLSGAKDIDNRSRIENGIIDIGADEFEW